MARSTEQFRWQIYRELCSQLYSKSGERPAKVTDYAAGGENYVEPVSLSALNFVFEFVYFCVFVCYCAEQPRI